MLYFIRVFYKISPDLNLDIFNKKKKQGRNHSLQIVGTSFAIFLLPSFKMDLKLWHILILYLYEIIVPNLQKIIFDSVKVPKRSPSDTVPKDMDMRDCSVAGMYFLDSWSQF